MKIYSAGEIRNVVVMGHSGSGKTTLMEACLFATKVTSRMGRVEDGNTVSDYDAEETRRGSSVSASMIPVEWNGTKINFMDTPGYFDFVGAAKEALHVADAALILVNAKSGIEVGTELAFESAAEAGIPKMMLVTGMDDEHADYYKVVAAMKEHFGQRVAPLMLPFSDGGKFAGYVSALTGKAYKFDAAGGHAPCEMPAGMQGAYDEHRAALVESIAETDEALMEKFFGDEELTEEELVRGLRAGLEKDSIAPVLCAVATTGAGVPALLDFLTSELPPAAVLAKETKVRKGGAEVCLPLDESGPVCAFVFKTISDPFVGRLSLFRVYSGTVKKETQLFNVNNETPEKAGHLFIMRGKEQLDATEIRAGDIGAIAKLSATNTQDTLATKAEPYLCGQIAFPESLYSMAVSAKGKGDEDKLSSTFSKILAEDRTLKFEINKETKQTVLSAIGDGQLDVLVNRLRTRYKMEIELNTPLVPYRETIKGKSDVKGKFVKQTGGGGQYGIVDMRFEPSGDIEKPYVFEEVVVGGNVPKQYFPAVEKGLVECVKAGPVAAYPVVGVKATLYDGKYHAVDSSELAFKMAATIAFKDGFMQAKPTLLEPVMKITVMVPDDFTGDIMGDMNKRRGRILGMEKIGAKQAISAEAPHSELLKYPIDLRSMTQGRGSFTMSFERYDEAPPDVQAKVIAARKKDLEAMRQDG